MYPHYTFSMSVTFVTSNIFFLFSFDKNYSKNKSKKTV